MRSAWARSGFLSISTLASRTLPRVAATAFSSAGASCLQGPHQVAQKSTMTGASIEAAMTSASKVAVVTSLIGAAPFPAADCPSARSIILSSVWPLTCDVAPAWASGTCQDTIFATPACAGQSFAYIRRFATGSVSGRDADETAAGVAQG